MADEQQAAEQPAEQRLHPRSDRVQGGGAPARDPAPGRVTAPSDGTQRENSTQLTHGIKVLALFKEEKVDLKVGRTPSPACMQRCIEPEAAVVEGGSVGCSKGRSPQDLHTDMCIYCIAHRIYNTCLF